MNETTLLVEVRNVKKSFGKVEALGGISLNLEENNQYVVKGTSGSGKSTLLYLMGGLDRPSEGEIFISGKNLSSLTDEELAKFRNQFVGFVLSFLYISFYEKTIKILLLYSDSYIIYRMWNY